MPGDVILARWATANVRMPACELRTWSTLRLDGQPWLLAAKQPNPDGTVTLDLCGVEVTLPGDQLVAVEDVLLLS